MSDKLVLEWQYTPIVNENSPESIHSHLHSYLSKNANCKLFFHCMCERSEEKNHPTSQHDTAKHRWHAMCYDIFILSLALLKYFNLIKMHDFLDIPNTITVWIFEHFIFTPFVFFISQTISISIQCYNRYLIVWNCCLYLDLLFSVLFFTILLLSLSLCSSFVRDTTFPFQLFR